MTAQPPFVSELDQTIELAPEHLEALAQVSTATLATILFGRGFRNQVLAGIRFVNDFDGRMVGPAYTMRQIPAREDLDQLAAFKDYDHPQRAAIEQCPEGHVLVVDSRGEGRAASAGNILMTRLQVRGGAGFVTDGTLRDFPELSQMQMPIFSAGASPMTNLAQHHVVDSQVPIACAGVAIYPGDVIVGDRDGIICVPRYLVAEIAEQAVAQEHREAWILRQVEEGAPLRGTYPPNEDALARYAATREGSGE
jgi:regulator of RNase E activity RraA